MSAGTTIDYNRMRELLAIHGTEPSGIKLVAAAMDVARLTVQEFIKREAKAAKAAKAENSTPRAVKSPKPIPVPKPVETVIEKAIPVIEPMETVSNLPEPASEPSPIPTSNEPEPVPVITSPTVIVNSTPADGPIPALDVSKPATIDPAYYAILDDLANDFSENADSRREIAKRIAGNGMRGIKTTICEWHDYMDSSLSCNQSRAELDLALVSIANAAIQGLMFLDTLEEW